MLLLPEPQNIIAFVSYFTGLGAIVLNTFGVQVPALFGEGRDTGRVKEWNFQDQLANSAYICRSEEPCYKGEFCKQFQVPVLCARAVNIQSM